MKIMINGSVGRRNNNSNPTTTTNNKNKNDRKSGLATGIRHTKIVSSKTGERTKSIAMEEGEQEEEG